MEIKEIVHQDVKPANMLINMKTEFKLCDFGISNTFDELKSNIDVIGGTAKYMPPTRELTIQDDMWALGISLVEVVDGKNPFPDDKSIVIAIEIMQWTPTVPTTISHDMQKMTLHL